ARYYSRLLGRITAAGLLAQIPVALVATLLFQVGGDPLGGWFSVGCCFTAAALAMLLRDVRAPDRPAPTADVGLVVADSADANGTSDGVTSSVHPADELTDDPDDDSGLGYFATLRVGVVEAVGTPA